MLKKYKPNTPKTCTRCGLTQPTKKFPQTKARGRIQARSWCAECLKSYYRLKKRPKPDAKTKAKSKTAAKAKKTKA